MPTWRAASFINEPQAISSQIFSPSSGVNFVGRCAGRFDVAQVFAFGRTLHGMSRFYARGLRKRYVFRARWTASTERLHWPHPESGSSVIDPRSRGRARGVDESTQNPRRCVYAEQMTLR